MEPIVEVGSLIERLNARYTVRDEFSTTNPLCNPDGPEAAAEITRLRSLLIDPGSPAWEDARAVLVAELRKAGMAGAAYHVVEKQPAMIQSHIALNLIAHSRQALQAERDKERGSVVAWLGKRAESLTVHPDATEADRQRADFAKEVIALLAEAVRINKHRGTEHV